MTAIIIQCNIQYNFSAECQYNRTGNVLWCQVYSLINPFFLLFSFFFSFLMHVFLSYVLSLICEAVLCLELVFAELGQAHINLNKNILLETPHEDMA